MIKKVLLILLSSASLLMVACASNPPLTVDYNDQFNFSQIKTYAHLEPQQQGSEVASGLMQERIRNAIDDQMLLLGYQKVPADKAHVLIAHTVIGREKVDVRTYYHGRRRYRCAMCGYSTVDVRQYTEGTLIIDVLDTKDAQVVWRGVTTARAKQHLTPEERTARINERVAYMLADFPPN